MRRFANLVRQFFRQPRLRYRFPDDPTLPFTAEEFGRLIRSGKHEDMKALADGLTCRSISGRPEHRAAN